MARAWLTLDRAETPAGTLELRRRGERDFLLSLAGRVLMTSAAHHSEAELARLAVEPIADRRAPRVLTAGLGLGFTLRAALDALPDDARVTVAELEPVVVGWCRGVLDAALGGALSDPRVRVEVGDVADTLARATRSGGRFDAIALDLFEGPRGDDDPHLGRSALRGMRDALAPGGVLAVWSERPQRAFERSLSAAGYAFECHRAGRGGLRHAVYRARPAR